MVPPGEVLENPKLSLGTAAAKARLAAKLGGGELAVRADEGLSTAVEFRASGNAEGLTQENAVARYIAVASESGLYPLPPYDPAKRHLAGQIDAWIDFAALTVQLRLRKVLAAASKQEADKEMLQLAKGLTALEGHLAGTTYLAGHSLSLADVILCCDLKPAFEKVVDPSVRQLIPHTVRWFTTLLQQQHFASVLGPVSMAPAPFVPAGAASDREQQQGGRSKEPPGAAAGGGVAAKGTKVGKAGKEKSKPAKPEKAAKPLANGGPAGAGEKKKETKLGLSTKKSEDFGSWYSEVVVESEMISYYDVSGCYILRPNSFAVWEAITRFFDAGIKALGVQNAYFPLFVTESALNTEKDHVEGFAAEVAWVTKSGQSELDRPIAIRPTSETVMYPYYAQWIRSHRDLPLRLNQWTNVVRWEFKHPTPFIRTREFLWQEGHTAFATKEEAAEEVMQILDLYARVYTELLAVPICKGTKSDNEKFAGALYSCSVEAFVPATGRGVQGGTSHCLGQNFSRMFGIEFETEQGGKAHAWQNSWGLSTRTIGVMVMVHGDDKGLVMPPRVAPTQLVAIPITAAAMPADAREKLAATVAGIMRALKERGVRAALDDRDNYRPGWKYNHWEVKGVPIRLELGAKDMEAGSCVLARRDTGAKEACALADVASRVPALLEQIQADMFARASEEFEACKESASTWEEFMAALDRRHMVLAPWADEVEIEEGVRKRSATSDAMGAKTLCIPLQQPPLPEGTKCFASGKPAKNWALWGRSY